MHWKRLWFTALAIYVAGFITNFIIHNLILGGYYARPEIVTAFRPTDQMNQYMWVMFITGAVFSFFFAFIFAKGYEGRGIAEGFRYGICIALFYYYVTSFEQFIMYPIPYGLTWIWVIAGFIQSVIYGVLAALIYKPQRAAAVATAG
jgi:hypothetical protein